MPTYTNVPELKSRMGITVASYDRTLGDELDAAEQVIRTFLNYDPAQATATEYYSTDGTDRLVLARSPVVAVTSVYEDRQAFWGTAAGSFDATAAILTAGADYALEADGVSKTGVLRRINTFWPYTYGRPIGRLASEVAPCPGCVKVTYLAGSSPMLADIVSAAYLEATLAFRMRLNASGVLQSETADGLSVALTPVAVSEDNTGPFLSVAAYKRCRPHRRVAIGVHR